LCSVEHAMHEANLGPALLALADGRSLTLPIVEQFYLAILRELDHGAAPRLHGFLAFSRRSSTLAIPSVACLS